jgi:hypothetical protein
VSKDVKYKLGLLKTQHCITQQSDDQEGIPGKKKEEQRGSNKQEKYLRQI